MGFDQAAEGYSESDAFEVFGNEIFNDIDSYKKDYPYLENVFDRLKQSKDIKSILSIQTEIKSIIGIYSKVNPNLKDDYDNDLNVINGLIERICKKLLSLDLVNLPAGTIIPKSNINPTLFGEYNPNSPLMIVVKNLDAEWEYALLPEPKIIKAFCEWHKSDVSQTLDRLNSYIDAGFHLDYKKTILVPDDDSNNFLSLGPCKLNVKKSLKGNKVLGKLDPTDKITCYWELKKTIIISSNFSETTE